MIIISSHYIYIYTHIHWALRNQFVQRLQTSLFTACCYVSPATPCIFQRWPPIGQDRRSEARQWYSYHSWKTLRLCTLAWFQPPCSLVLSSGCILCISVLVYQYMNDSICIGINTRWWTMHTHIHKYTYVRVCKMHKVLLKDIYEYI